MYGTECLWKSIHWGKCLRRSILHWKEQDLPSPLVSNLCPKAPVPSPRKWKPKDSTFTFPLYCFKNVNKYDCLLFKLSFLSYNWCPSLLMPHIFGRDKPRRSGMPSFTFPSHNTFDLSTLDHCPITLFNLRSWFCTSHGINYLSQELNDERALGT